MWRGGAQGEPEQLANCYRNAIALAQAHKLRSLAFPNISTGVYGYPKEAAAKVALSAVQEAVGESSTLERILFVCFDTENYALYQEALGAGK